MSIGHVILGVLVAGPRHGYAVRNELAQRLGSAWPVNQGQVYATLRRLVTSGLVAQLAEAPRASRRTARYALLPAGRGALEGWLARSVVGEPPVDELHVKLALRLERGECEAARGLVELQLAAAGVLLSALEAERRALERMPAPAPAAQSAHDLAIGLLAAELEALARLREAIAAPPPESESAGDT